MRRPTTGIVLLAGTLAVLAACDGPATDSGARIESAESIVAGESLGLTAIGLVPGEVYSLTTEATDPLDRLWSSTAAFRADASGVIDPARHAPEQGAYNGIDEQGLLWSAVMPEPPGEDWQAPEPAAYWKLKLRLERDGQPLAEHNARQWLRPPDVAGEPWGEGLVAEIFLPPDAPAPGLPGLVFLGGSGGGKQWASRTAALVARQGFAGVALAYFNGEGLPEHLAQVPIEPVFAALDQLAADPRIDAGRIGLVGYSKGAELALLVASRRPDVGAVVAFAPGSAVFQGFKPPRYPTISSWSQGGADLPFVPNAYDDKFFETFDGMYLWYRTLAQHDTVAAAAIPVEKIEGPILMLTGVEDRIWPATYMAEQIIARLHVEEFAHPVRHLAFLRAGHGIAAPPGEPTTSVATRLGGSAAGNAAARREGWRAMSGFLAAWRDGDELPDS